MSVELAVITAAGFDMRLGLSVPKCLLRLAGHTVIERQLRLLQDVPEVAVVVGFQADETIAAVEALRKDVTFVHNVDHATTSVRQSIAMAVAGERRPFLSVPGDVVFEPVAFAEFLEQCTSPGLLGVTKTVSDQARCVTTSASRDGHLQVQGFQQTPRTGLEWSGLAYLHTSWMDAEPGYMYELIEECLPLRALAVPSYEIDTPSDLERANEGLRAGRYEPADSKLEAERRFGVRRDVVPGVRVGGLAGVAAAAASR